MVAPSSVVISWVRKSSGNGWTCAAAGHARASAPRTPTRTLNMGHLLRLRRVRRYTVPSGWNTQLAELSADTMGGPGQHSRVRPIIMTRSSRVSVVTSILSQQRLEVLVGDDASWWPLVQHTTHAKRGKHA